MNALASFPTLATLFSLGFFSGLNVYAVVFVSGLAIRFHWITLTPELASLETLAHPAVLIVSGLLYFVEFFADKIPWIDNIWDAIHTVIRPLAAVFLALHVLGDQNVEVKVIAALVCGTIALTSHAAKAGTRISTNLISPAEPFSNIGLSLAEDAIAIGGLYFVYKHPYIALGIVLAFLVAIIYFAPKLYRAIRTFFRLTAKTPSRQAQ
ncbi:DUF4126 domain-containing protein [bacterium]|nr:DUF4126 domain-containing protein [bacterium]MCI0602467.1 DUF4126 domain-containing protein [bacterium]